MKERWVRGVKMRRTNDDKLVSHFETMSEAVVAQVKIMTGNQCSVDVYSIDESVEDTVRRELLETKQLISRPNDAIIEVKDKLLALNNLLK